jgi:endonuclease G, mitochondrial
MTRTQLLNSIGLIEELIAPGRPNRSGRAITVRYLTIHNTDNTSPGADARAHSRFVRNTGYYTLPSGRRNYVSWHYTVDDARAIRQLPNNERGIHAGAGNGSSIGMEICMHRGINQAAANDRAARLAALLLYDHRLSVDRLRTHQSWTGKRCPSLLIIEGRWQAFVETVQNYLSQIRAARGEAIGGGHADGGEDAAFTFQPCDCGGDHSGDGEGTNPLAEAAWERFHSDEAAAQRDKVETALAEGNPLAAEPSPDRRAAAIRRGGAEVVHGPTADFLNISFLEIARRRANAVGRIIFRNGRAQGTGFMISDTLLMTNNHVIESARAAGGFLVEFDYELTIQGQTRPVTRFEFDPARCFVTDHIDDLDYTIIAVGRRVSGSRNLSDFGFVPLSSSSNRHAIGEYVNIIQHPDGDFKKISLHENRIVTRLDKVLHYITDTNPGASGSPVFNLRCEAIALHHWGSPHRQTTTPDGRPVSTAVNEGIRISAIVSELRQRLPALAEPARTLINAVVRSSENAVTGDEDTPAAPAPAAALHTTTTVQPDGSTLVSTIFPVRIDVRTPATCPPPADIAPAPVAPLPGDDGGDSEKVTIDPNYENRRGYDPGFLEGYDIPLPELNAAQKKLAAISSEPSPGKPRYVLDYQHFSIAVHGTRRTAFYCATNIDGKSWKNINRDTGRISESAEAEARETWYADPRLDAGEQCNDEDYKEFRQFHRGHLVRRQYPSWGSAKNARRANADTFHWTNCALQHSQFNPKTNRWLGLEDYVLNNARDNDVRVTVFSGPVLKDKDPLYGSLRAPLLFWKVAVRLDGDGLTAIGLLASQEDLLKPAGEELDPLPAKLKGYQVSIARIEKETGLSFGDLSQYDVLGSGESAAASMREISTPEDILLYRRTASPKSKKKQAPRRKSR